MNVEIDGVVHFPMWSGIGWYGRVDGVSDVPRVRTECGKEAWEKDVKRTSDAVNCSERGCNRFIPIEENTTNTEE